MKIELTKERMSFKKRWIIGGSLYMIGVPLLVLGGGMLESMWAVGIGFVLILAAMCATEG